MEEPTTTTTAPRGALDAMRWGELEEKKKEERFASPQHERKSHHEVVMAPFGMVSLLSAGSAHGNGTGLITVLPLFPLSSFKATGYG